MKAKRFYAVLSKTIRTKKWEVKMSPESGYIRIFSRYNGFTKQTPLTVVCRELKKGRFHWSDEVAAGKALGLKKEVITKIRKATFMKTARGRITLERHLGLNCRRRLI